MGLRCLAYGLSAIAAHLHDELDSSTQDVTDNLVQVGCPQYDLLEQEYSNTFKPAK